MGLELNKCHDKFTVMKKRITSVYFSASKAVAIELADLLAKEGVEFHATPEGCCNGSFPENLSLERWLEVADLAARTGEVKLYQADGREICCLPIDAGEVRRLFPGKSEKEIMNAIEGMKFGLGTLKLLKPQNIFNFGAK